MHRINRRQMDRTNSTELGKMCPVEVMVDGRPGFILTTVKQYEGMSGANIAPDVAEMSENEDIPFDMMDSA